MTIDLFQGHATFPKHTIDNALEGIEKEGERVWVWVGVNSLPHAGTLNTQNPTHTTSPQWTDNGGEESACRINKSIYK